MAKMTIDNVTYEGTADEIRDMAEAFGMIAPEDVEADQPAETLTFEGAEYALVSRKAEVGDVVVFTANDNSYFTNGKPYGPIFGRGNFDVKDNEGDTLAVYNDSNGRTESTVIVYEKVAEESALKVGDKVEVIDGSKSEYGDFETGTICEITDIELRWKESHRVDTDYDFDRFPASALRKVTEAVSEEPAQYPEKGDIVRATRDYHEIKEGAIGVVIEADGSNRPVSLFNNERPRFAHVELVARAKDRVDTK